MGKSLIQLLESEPAMASAPCRIDMGGTLDISTFAYSLRYLSPCTFNVAINLRTRVVLRPFREGFVKVSSRGFESAEYRIRSAPYDHPLGLMFAVAAYFNADGVHIEIDSSSPPRSALGGSSAATVALVGAFLKVYGDTDSAELPFQDIARISHGIEASVAGAPCGIQDQLAAIYGGVNAWYWQERIQGPMFRKETVVEASLYKDLQRHILLAYCGIPHVSEDINGIWVKQFLSGQSRRLWEEIVLHTKAFVDALTAKDYSAAAEAMNAEVAIRRELTPGVIDRMGDRLVAAAIESGCGARFTGAGGGGCLWALGPAQNIKRLENQWRQIISARNEARLIDMEIDSQGLIVS